MTQPSDRNEPFYVNCYSCGENFESEKIDNSQFCEDCWENPFELVKKINSLTTQLKEAKEEIEKYKQIADSNNGLGFTELAKNVMDKNSKLEANLEVYRNFFEEIHKIQGFDFNSWLKAKAVLKQCD